MTIASCCPLTIPYLQRLSYLDYALQNTFYNLPPHPPVATLSSPPFLSAVSALPLPFQCTCPPSFPAPCSRSSPTLSAGNLASVTQMIFPALLPVFSPFHTRDNTGVNYILPSYARLATRFARFSRFCIQISFCKLCVLSVE